MKERKLLVEVTDEEYQALKEGLIKPTKKELLDSVEENDLPYILKRLCKNYTVEDMWDGLTGKTLKGALGEIRLRNGNRISFTILGDEVWVRK